jgi:bacterioferritin (cytochrome b1)
MVNSDMMSAAPAAIVDVLNGLLEGEMSSIFRFMDDASPYLSRAKADIRRPLHEMVETNERHIGELHELILDLGGVPIPSAFHPEEQYLAFLSLKFLLPKLVEAKRFAVQRYQNALKSIRSHAPAQVVDLMSRHMAEHRAQLEVLEAAAAKVAAGE